MELHGMRPGAIARIDAIVARGGSCLVYDAYDGIGSFNFHAYLEAGCTDGTMTGFESWRKVAYHPTGGKVVFSSGKHVMGEEFDVIFLAEGGRERLQELGLIVQVGAGEHNDRLAIVSLSEQGKGGN